MRDKGKSSRVREFFFMGATLAVYSMLQCGIINLRSEESQAYTNTYHIKQIKLNLGSALQAQERTSPICFDD